MGARHNELIGEMKDEYRIWAWKPKRRKILRKSSRGWKDNIKKDLRELGWDGVDWIDMARDIKQMVDLCNKKN